MNPACVDCQREMFCAKTGRVIEVRVILDDGSERPHQLWRADEFRCRACNSSVLVAAKEAWMDFGVNREEFIAQKARAEADNNLRPVRVR